MLASVQIAGFDSLLFALIMPLSAASLCYVWYGAVVFSSLPFIADTAVVFYDIDRYLTAKLPLLIAIHLL